MGGTSLLYLINLTTQVRHVEMQRRQTHECFSLNQTNQKEHVTCGDEKGRAVSYDMLQPLVCVKIIDPHGPGDGLLLM